MHEAQNLETNEPLLVIGNTVYEGRCEDVVGTQMVFDPARRGGAGYVTSATRKIVFRRSSREPNERGAGSLGDSTEKQQGS